MLGCKVLGVCCARLPRRVTGTAGRRAEGGGAVRRCRGGAREGRVGGEERGVPETRQCGYRATPRYHAKTSNHPSPPHRRAACRRRCRRAGALMQR